MKLQKLKNAKDALLGSKPVRFIAEKTAPVRAEYRFLKWCMLIPAAIVFLIYLVRGLHPIADGCVLVLDLNGQYVWFFEALRNFVRGDAELLYSFSRALGGEFLGIYAYYLASPLSYLVCLFPTDRMLEALLCLFLLKTAICGGTFGYYMHKTMPSKNHLAIVLFSCCYALSSYALVQQHNTMWIDAVMWLPLITLGIESVIKYGKFKLYTISMAVAVFSNYYIGYMLCFWCLIYFFLYYVSHPKEVRNPTGERVHFLRSLLRMAFYSLIALGIAAVILLAAFYSLNFGKTTFSTPDWEFATKFDLLDLFFKLLPGSYDTVRPEGLPFVYCGLLSLLLLPSYFLCKKYPTRQKLGSLILLFILFLSMSINVVDLVWHGFQTPNWLNYRYSFMFSFYLCVIACRAFEDFEGLSLKVLLGTGGAVALLCVILQRHLDGGEYTKYADFTSIYFSLFLIFGYLAILSFWKRTDRKLLARNGFVILLASELFISGLLNIILLDVDVGYSRYSRYNNFLDATRPIVERVQESDSSFYRMEKTVFRKTNDNMALNIRGLSGSTSTLNKETVTILNKLGYASKSHWSKYLGGTPVSDSLLGLKYIVSDNEIYENYYSVYMTDEENGLVAYKNPNALSIAYGVSDDVLEFPLGFLPLEEALPTEDETETESKDETESTNGDEERRPGAVTLAVDALKDLINEYLGIEENDGVVYEDAYNSPFERMNAMVTAMLGESETVRIFVPISDYTEETKGLLKGYYAGDEHGFTNSNPDDHGSLTYTARMPVDGELFFYMPTNYPREVDLTLTANTAKPTDWGTFHGNESDCVISLGQRKANDVLKLEMTLIEDDLYILSNEDCFYYIDWQVFDDAFSRLKSDQLQLTDYSESSFSGTLKASRENELVMTTIPYDNGWQIYVDGTRVEPEKAFGAFLSFHVGGNAGDTHTVELVYRPHTIAVGLTISGISLLVLILLLIIDRFHKLGCRPKKAPDIPHPSISITTEQQTFEDMPSDITLSENAPPRYLRIRFPSQKDRKDD